MNPSYKPIPSTADIRASLSAFSRKQLDDLGELTGVPPTTIYKIKLGVTRDPGLETVRKLLPHLRPVKPKVSRSPSSVRRSA